MNKDFHSLLPIRSQMALMGATKINLNDTIKAVVFECSSKYHTKDTLDERVFFDQPRGPIGNAKFIHAAPSLG